MNSQESVLRFILKKDMASVYKIEDISDLPQTAYYHFMNYDDEVLYFLSADGNMAGVLSIGDLERFYDEDRPKLEIIRQYTFIRMIDYEAAVLFFKRVKTVNELPIISDGGNLLGVIQKDKEPALRMRQKKSLRDARKNQWQRKELLRFISRTKARVLLYSMSVPKIMEQMGAHEKEILVKRQQCTDSSKWKGLSDSEWEIFWKSENEDDIVNSMKKEMRKVFPVVRNGVAELLDIYGKCFHFQDGYRVTPNNPSNADRRILMFGPCVILGEYCKDNETIAYYLQSELNKNNYTAWKVLNKGLIGLDYCTGRMFTEELSEDDIVIFWFEEETMPKNIESKVSLQGDLTELFLNMPSLVNYLVDSVWHFNYVLNQKLADKIFSDLCNINIIDSPRLSKNLEKIQNYYIGWDIREYFADYFSRYNLHKEDEDIRVGAIVMNCNPFTKGHRYLIECALQSVDKLYVFVVEEDKSYFKFEDRLKMVEMGVSDLSNVWVIPSGKYILSKETFAQYFDKEQFQILEILEDMDYDLYIFGEVVAAGLGIQYRFVGEEPFDKVTKKYNETMKRILPEFGVAVIEIPRVTLENNKGQVISATLVRKALQEKDWQSVEKFCPVSTVMYLREKRYISSK